MSNYNVINDADKAMEKMEKLKTEFERKSNDSHYSCIGKIIVWANEELMRLEDIARRYGRNDNEYKMASQEYLEKAKEWAKYLKGRDVLLKINIRELADKIAQIRGVDKNSLQIRIADQNVSMNHERGQTKSSIMGSLGGLYYIAIESADFRDIHMQELISATDEMADGKPLIDHTYIQRKQNRNNGWIEYKSRIDNPNVVNFRKSLYGVIAMGTEEVNHAIIKIACEKIQSKSDVSGEEKEL